MGWTVRDVYECIDGFAPFDTAMEGDNVGLLAGRMEQPVQVILTALDATPGAVLEARSLGAQLLVTHHPVLFTPRTRLDESDPEAALLCDIVRANLSLIAAHTNLDAAPGGVNDTLLSLVGWGAWEPDGLIRKGAFSPPRSLADLEAQVSGALAVPVIRYGDPGRVVGRFAVCSGSGNGEIAHAAQTGAEVFLTGEIKHGNALEAMARGMAVLAAGHRATEICAAELLASRLQLAADALQLNVRVFASKYNPFA